MLFKMIGGKVFINPLEFQDNDTFLYFRYKLPLLQRYMSSYLQPFFFNSLKATQTQANNYYVQYLLEGKFNPWKKHTYSCCSPPPHKRKH